MYLSRRPDACAVVQGEHRLPSRGPQLQALACTLDDASRLEHTSQFGTMEPCPFTDCGFVNLGWALAQGSRRATERWARQGSASTAESDAVRMGGFNTAGCESAVAASGVFWHPCDRLLLDQPYDAWLCGGLGPATNSDGGWRCGLRTAGCFHRCALWTDVGPRRRPPCLSTPRRMHARAASCALPLGAKACCCPSHAG